MPIPKSGTFDLGDGGSPLVLPRLASRPHAARPMGRFRKTVCELMTSFLAWRARRETLRLLSSLDAAALRDLGLTDIESRPSTARRRTGCAVTIRVGGRQDGVESQAAFPPRIRAMRGRGMHRVCGATPADRRSAGGGCACRWRRRSRCTAPARTAARRARQRRSRAHRCRARRCGRWSPSATRRCARAGSR